MIAIVMGMNGGKKVSEENERIYIREYFNVIYGRAISRIGTYLKKQARLTVPTIFIGNSNENSWYACENTENIAFKNKYGVMKLRLSDIER